MISSFMALSFVAPWALGTLLVLPVIWWLLKIKPPSPRVIEFPAIRFLLSVQSVEQTPAKTPIWLLLFRILIATLIILAISGPVINPPQMISQDGPIVIVIDDGWGGTANWQKQIQAVITLIEQAEVENKKVIVALSAPRAEQGRRVTSQVSNLLLPREAKNFVKTLVPQAWPVDRASLLKSLMDQFTDQGIEKAAAVYWFSDGLHEGNVDVTARFSKSLMTLGPVHVFVEPLPMRAMLLLAPGDGGRDFLVRVLKSSNPSKSVVWIRATGVAGNLIDRIPVEFERNQTVVERPIILPNDIRNEIARLDIEGSPGAGSVVLVDSRWRHRSVGFISGGGFESRQPLLSDLYYLERALAPYIEIRRGPIEKLIEDNVSVLMLADVGNLPAQEQEVLSAWIEDGGVLVRFAGPRLAAGIDALVPTPLRNSGERAVGGALSWQEPVQLEKFMEDSPFFGIQIPEDVTIRRQVLAEPSIDLQSKTWARLIDGTPLVTGIAKGAGWLVLFHTSANAEWSNLSLSGVFVEMLRRVVELSEGGLFGSENLVMPPFNVLDGYGRSRSPGPMNLGINAEDIDEWVPNPFQPPGVYGTEVLRRAFNLGHRIEELRPILEFPSGIEVSALQQSNQLYLRPWLILIAVLLSLLDLIIAMFMRGLLPVRNTLAVLGFMYFFSAIMILGDPALAQTSLDEANDSSAPRSLSDPGIVEATRSIHLAYVVTGSKGVDAVSRAGLIGLSWVLRQRTSVEPGLPVGVNPEEDSLVLYPLIYWPITNEQPLLSDRGLANIEHYLTVGGMILLDTRDQTGSAQPQNNIRQSPALFRQMLKNLNLPALSVVSQGHALTQSFYLMDRFPGRWDNGEVWVEEYEGGVNDGVSSLVVGGNDWAGAWALSPSGEPLFPVVPGGEKQRELAFRFGVNIMMYSLTGNYKADQVHISTILRRLKRTDLLEPK